MPPGLNFRASSERTSSGRGPPYWVGDSKQEGKEGGECWGGPGEVGEPPGLLGPGPCLGAWGRGRTGQRWLPVSMEGGPEWGGGPKVTGGARSQHWHTWGLPGRCLVSSSVGRGDSVSCEVLGLLINTVTLQGTSFRVLCHWGNSASLEGF